MKSQLRTVLFSVFLVISTASVSVVPTRVVHAAPSAEASDYSVLPETFSNRPDLRPNILIVLDTSGSMTGFFGEDENEDPFFAFDAGRADLLTSRSSQVRKAFRDVLGENVGNFNIGLMTYGGGAKRRSGSRTIVQCNDYGDGSATPDLSCVNTGSNTVYRYQKSNDVYNGKGLLVSELKPLNQTHLAELNTRLANEPQKPTYTGSGNNGSANDGRSIGNAQCLIEEGCSPYQTGTETFFTDIGTAQNQTRDPLQDGTAISFGSTPLAGSLNTARAYLSAHHDSTAASNFSVSTDYNFNEAHPSTWQTDPDTGANYVNFPELAFGGIEDCRPNTYVFFLTDGLPGGESYVSFEGGSSKSSNLSNAIDEAHELFADGVETWMFGFGLSTTAEISAIQSLADAGQGAAATAGSGRAFFAADSDELSAQLSAALDEVSVTGGSASGISVVTSSVQSTGAVVQALYSPEEVTILDDSVDPPITTDPVYWTGTLSMYFFDEFGNLREDNGLTPGVLQDDDAIFELDFNELTQSPFAIRNPGEIDEEIIDVAELEPIWEASEILSNYDQEGGDGTTNAFLKQRNYNDVADPVNGYRHILASYNNGTTTQVIDFIWSDSSTDNAITPSNFTMLALDSDQDDIDGDSSIEWSASGDDKLEAISRAQDLIAFTRGKEGTGLRNRTLLIDLDSNPLTTGDQIEKPLILGDILHSTSVQVDLPNDTLNLLFPSVASSYANFKDHYAETGRRRVVYAGGNDGMIHAFNAGFWDQNTITFSKSNPNDATMIEHDLGAELWAYIPHSLLPHLKWLSEKTYSSSEHISYMDGPIQTFDVQIFNDDEDHPDGWGTILVAGMRLGGGKFPEIDHDADISTPTITTTSSYIVLDITNPEKPPVLVAELTDDNIGYTTSQPTIVREVDNLREVDWYLVFGSGPTDIETSTSDQQARLFRYDLKNEIKSSLQLSDPNSFIGDISSVDWDFDYTHETVYFGTIEGTIDVPSGKLNRVFNSSISTVIDVGQPVVYRATAETDGVGNNWLLFGTGRLFDTDDFIQADQNSFYGVKETLDLDGSTAPPEVVVNEMLNSGDIDVGVDGTISSIVQTVGQVGTAGEVSDNDGNSITNFTSLKQYMQSTSPGWRANFDVVGANSTRSSVPAVTFRDFVLYTGFMPPVQDGNACTNEQGTSSLFALDFSTGTPFAQDGFDGLLGSTVEADGTVILDRSLDSVIDGIALSLAIVVTEGESGEPVLGGPISGSGGGIEVPKLPIPPAASGRKSWTEIPLTE